MDTESLIKLGNQLSAELKEIRGEVHNVSVTNITISCNNRYLALNQAKNEMIKGMSSDDFRVSAKVRFFDAYWALQHEQYFWYRRGFIPNELYRYYLYCRRRDYSIGEVIKAAMVPERKKNAGNQNRMLEIRQVEQAATNEQNIFQHGWEHASLYLNDRPFVTLMGNVMTESSDTHINYMMNWKTGMPANPQE